MEEKVKRFVVGGLFEIKISIPARDKDEAKDYTNLRLEELIKIRLSEILLELNDAKMVEVNLKKLNRVVSEGEKEVEVKENEDGLEPELLVEAIIEEEEGEQDDEDREMIAMNMEGEM